MPTFDVVSEVNMQEVRNALEQVKREISTRYDFKGSKSSVDLPDETTIVIIADDKMRLQSVQDILKQKLAKRGVSPKLVEFLEAKPAASDTLRQEIKVKQGLKDEELKRLTKAIKASEIKVSAQIQGNQVRVSGKKKDDLQEIISKLRAEITDIELQFVNFRD